MVLLYIILTVNVTLLILFFFLIKTRPHNKLKTRLNKDQLKTRLNKDQLKTRLNKDQLKTRLNKFEYRAKELSDNFIKGKIIGPEYAVKISKNSVSENKWEIGINISSNNRDLSDKISYIMKYYELEPIFEKFLKTSFISNCLEIWYGEEYNTSLNSLEKTLYIVTRKKKDKYHIMNALEYNMETKKSMTKLYTTRDNNELYKDIQKIIPPKIGESLFQHFKKYMVPTIGDQNLNGVVKVNNNESIMGIYIYIKLPAKESQDFVKFCIKNFNVDLNEVMSRLKNYTFHIAGVSRCRQIDNCKDTWKIMLSSFIIMFVIIFGILLKYK